MQTTWVNVNSGSLNLEEVIIVCLRGESPSEAVRNGNNAYLCVRLLVSSIYFRNAYST